MDPEELLGSLSSRIEEIDKGPSWAQEDPLMKSIYLDYIKGVYSELKAALGVLGNE